MFDARAAKALAPGNHLTVEEAPGLRLIATETTRTWTYRFRSPVDDRLRQTKLGHWPAMSFAAALGAWETVRQQRAAGVDPVQQKRAVRAVAASARRGAAYTTRVLCDDFLAWYLGTVEPKTYGEIARLFERHLTPIENTPASTVTRMQAFALIQSAKHAPVVARALKRGLGAAWDHALDAGLLPPETPNWWRLVLRGKLPSQGRTVAGERTGTVVKRVLSEAEVTLLLPFLPNFSRDVEDGLTLYLWTCCRGAEIVAMERDEITREADGVWWTVPKAKLKMRRNPLTVDLRVPLVGRALAVVERRLAAATGTWLFPSPGKRTTHIQQKAFGLAVWSHMSYAKTHPEWARSRLPVERWAPHDLRRTGRTMLAALGCPENIAEAIIGHLGDVYDRYGYDRERRVWLTRLSEKWETLAAGLK